MKKEIKKEKMSLEKLATMVANGFSGQEKKLTEKIDGVERKLTDKIDGVETRLGQQINGLGNRIDTLVDGKVSWADQNRLAGRVSRLEIATHLKK